MNRQCFCVGRNCSQYDICFPSRRTMVIAPPSRPKQTGVWDLMRAYGYGPVEKRCATCRHHHRATGQCRHDPPVADRTWPKVEKHDCCGKWEVANGTDLIDSGAGS